MNTQLPRQSSNGYAMSRNGNAANKIPRQLKITTKKLKMSQAFKTDFIINNIEGYLKTNLEGDWQ